LPWRRRGGGRTNAIDIRALPRINYDSCSSPRNGHAATLDENAKDTGARAGKEPRATYSDLTEFATNLHPRRWSFFPTVINDGPRLKCDLSTRIHQNAIDRKASILTNVQDRIQA